MIFSRYTSSFMGFESHESGPSNSKSNRIDNSNSGFWNSYRPILEVHQSKPHPCPRNVHDIRQIQRSLLLLYRSYMSVSAHIDNISKHRLAPFIPITMEAFIHQRRQYEASRPPLPLDPPMRCAVAVAYITNSVIPLQFREYLVLSSFSFRYRVKSTSNSFVRY
jgi:hypothetical protein